MAKTNLLQERIVYKPFEYQEAADYWLKQQQAHWLHTEVPMMSDVNDWKQNLSETEKNIIGSILKGFAQTETVVNDYWSGLVTKWFRKPEVIMMLPLIIMIDLPKFIDNIGNCFEFFNRHSKRSQGASSRFFMIKYGSNT